MSQFKVVYEDDNLMVIEKNANLVVDSSETQKEGTLQNILEKEYSINLERAGIVHRLDKDTSGLLLIAKNKNSLQNLQLQFKERMVKKEYLALVHGLIEKEGQVEGSILRNPRAREKFIVDEEGKDASTGYKPLELRILNEELRMKMEEGMNRNQKRKLERSGYGKFTLVRCFPLTGRTHQIRVHLKYINHPIVGDSKYAGRKTTRLDNRFCRRQFLHAAKIEFYHPKDGRKLIFESELPEDLTQVLENLKRITGLELS